jgi:hypothetical protein
MTEEMEMGRINGRYKKKDERGQTKVIFCPSYFILQTS